MPNYISKLTKKQEDLMPIWRDKWIEIGLRTGKTDWETFEKYIPLCYEKAGIPFPDKIIRVSSPIVGALASAISEAIFRKYIYRNPVGGAIYVAIDDAVRSAVGGAVYVAVGSAVDGAVRDAIDDAVSNTVGNAIDDAVRYAIDDVVYDAIRNAIGSAVGSAVYDAVRNAIDGTVGSAVGSAVSNTVDGAIYDAVGSAVGNAVYDAVEDAIKRLNLNIQWHYWMGGQFWVGGWYYGNAYLDFFIEGCNLKLSEDILERYEIYKKINESVNYWWPNRKFVMVCARPMQIYRNSQGQLHCENDLAIKYPDGWGLWMLNGVKVTENIVTTEANKLDCNLVLKEKNAEVRREIVRKIGIERAINQLGAKSIEKTDVYELLNFDCIDGHFRPYLKMFNPSIETWHIEGVHPDCDTIEKALAWRDNENKYEKPQILT